jgi:putative redox protein
MTHSATISFRDGLAFDAAVDDIHFEIDADPEFGGKERGPRPKKLLLAALAGCTGMDVASILGKMRMEFDEFKLEVEADMTAEDPKIYTAFRVKYIFRGNELDKEKIEKAISLSQDRYCGVTAMFRSFATIDTELVLNP